MLDNMKTGKRILLARQDKGYTQDEIAAKLGVTPQAVSRWERGNSMPDIEFLLPLSRLLGITVEDILTGEFSTINIQSPYEKNSASVLDSLLVDDINIYIAHNLIPLVEESSGGDLTKRVFETRKLIAKKYGILMPVVRIRDNINLTGNQYTISILGKEKIKAEGNADDIINSLIKIIEENLPTFITREMAKTLVDTAAVKYPITAADAVPGKISYGKLAKLIICILNEGKSVRNMYAVLNYICDADCAVEVEEMARQITTEL